MAIRTKQTAKFVHAAKATADIYRRKLKGKGKIYMKTWQIVLITAIVVLLIGYIGMNIYPYAKNKDDPQSDELAERASYILDYYDAKIDELNKNLNFETSYFTPIDIDNLNENRVADRYKLSQIEEYGFLPVNEYGAAWGSEIGNSMTIWLKDFDAQLEAFRVYTNKYQDISIEEARKFFIDMELWCTSSTEDANYITSHLDSYSEVLNTSWHNRIDTTVEELLKVQNEMLAISEEIYKAKQ